MQRRVLIIGGGVAGVSAAAAAVGSGADVVLLEASDTLGVDRSFFPYVLAHGYPLEGDVPAFASMDLAARGVDIELNTQVRSIDVASHTVRTADSRFFRFDTLVVATGSRASLESGTRGASKEGVHELRRLNDYARLSRAKGGMSHIVVVGPAPLSLLVAQALSGRVKVKVFLGRNGLGRFAPGVQRMVAQGASRAGVELLNSEVTSIVGMERVEAVLSSNGTVFPCDGVAMVPRSAPNLPDVGCSTGPRGGILVDRSMQTSSKGVFAAGDCTEMRLGATTVAPRLHSSSRTMGEVAGLNAAGAASARSLLTHSMALELFGVELFVSGIGLDDAVRAGLDPVRVESEAMPARAEPFGGGEVYVSIVYERPTHRILGIQAAGKGALGLAGSASLAVGFGVGLEDMMHVESPYLPSFNTDRSPIALTAAKAVFGTQERRIEAQGTRLRHH